MPDATGPSDVDRDDGDEVTRMDRKQLGDFTDTARADRQLPDEEGRPLAKSGPLPHPPVRFDEVTARP